MDTNFPKAGSRSTSYFIDQNCFKKYLDLDAKTVYDSELIQNTNSIVIWII